MYVGPPICGYHNEPSTTASANTVFRRLIPPFVGGSGDPPMKYSVDLIPWPNPDGTIKGKPNWYGPQNAYTHVVDMHYTSGNTAHALYFLRPLNWTYTAAAVGSNTTVMTVAYDPGAFATTNVYKYGTTDGSAPDYANNAMATSDVICFQLNDGSWQLDVVSAFSSPTITLTTGTPNVAGAGVPAYTPVFWFGAVGDTDPSTGMVQPFTNSVVNSRLVMSGPGGYPLWSGRHKGDPLVFVSSNGTAAGVLEHLSGFYSLDG